MIQTRRTTVAMTDALERALADVELVESAFPDEVTCVSQVSGQFPLQLRFQLSSTAHLILEWNEGYPETTNINVASYRSSPSEKSSIEEVVKRIKDEVNILSEEGFEGGLTCCSAALETWNDRTTAKHEESSTPNGEQTNQLTNLQQVAAAPCFSWTIGEPLVDRKSSFLAHACRIESEAQVHQALTELLTSHSKYRKATHNMLAWRVHERVAEKLVLKHDNDDDGEDAAGSRLALLLHTRNEDGVLVVVSRWYGGILLGPKRFAHITNTARQVLDVLRDSDRS